MWVLRQWLVPIHMLRTCLYDKSMSKMVQIRDLPDSVHGILKARAAREGISLSDFLKRELQHVAERPSMTEWLERTAQAKPLVMNRSSVEIVREMRDSK
jgi:hypothetical protein